MTLTLMNGMTGLLGLAAAQRSILDLRGALRPALKSPITSHSSGSPQYGDAGWRSVRRSLDV
jgi:hypothetical protein